MLNGRNGFAANFIGFAHEKLVRRSFIAGKNTLYEGKELRKGGVDGLMKVAHLVEFIRKK